MNVVYVEDRSTEAEIFDAILKEGGVQISTFEPPIDLDVNQIVDKKPELILLDYELNRKLQPGRHASFQGGTLAAKLREVFPDYPILLFTSRDVLRDYNWPNEQMGALDDTLYKEDLQKEPIPNIRRINGIGKGFAIIRGAKRRTWTSLVNLLGASAAEAELLRDTSPPLDVKAENKVVGWSVRPAAQWILKTLLPYPGIFYNALYASASLGVEEESFRSASFQEHFAGTRYEGPFSSVEEWWWRQKLHEKAFTFIKSAQLPPILAESFANAFNSATSLAFNKSKCISCGELSADCVCYILNKPVHRKCSLDYFPDKRLPVMDVARVSFKAIREDNRFQPELVGPEDKKLVSKIIREGTV